MTAQNAYRVLQLAEQHGLWIVEDDLHRELADPAAPMLAALDGLRRTLYVSGFSKTISPSLRAGYVVADAAITRELARTKMAVALTSSEITERIVHAFVTRPAYAEHVAHLNARLGTAHAGAEATMREHGAILFDTPKRGLFLWARLPGHADASALADRAIRHNIWLAPGQYFRPTTRPARGCASTSPIRATRRCGISSSTPSPGTPPRHPRLTGRPDHGGVTHSTSPASRMAGRGLARVSAPRVVDAPATHRCRERRRPGDLAGCGTLALCLSWSRHAGADQQGARQPGGAGGTPIRRTRQSPETCPGRGPVPAAMMGRPSKPPATLTRRQVPRRAR